MKHQEIKEQLKSLAKEIRKKKEQRKSCLSGYVPGLFSDRYEFRHRHIAYCLLKGTELSAIETPSGDNKPDMNLVENYKEDYSEALHDSRQLSA